MARAEAGLPIPAGNWSSYSVKLQVPPDATSVTVWAKIMGNKTKGGNPKDGHGLLENIGGGLLGIAQIVGKVISFQWSINGGMYYVSTEPSEEPDNNESVTNFYLFADGDEVEVTGIRDANFDNIQADFVREYGAEFNGKTLNLEVLHWNKWAEVTAAEVYIKTSP